MSAEDLLRGLKELMAETDAGDRLSAFRGYKYGRSDEEKAILDAGFDLFTSGLSLEMQATPAAAVNPPPIVVALIHGIRTAGLWQEQFRAAMEEEPNVKVVPLGYDYHDVFRFLGPNRGEAIEHVTNQLRDLQRQYVGSQLVVVAHSFGTYIVSKVLKGAVDVRVARLLLCGSIIPTRYRWDQLSHNFTQETLVNEVGTRDYWPVMARVFSWGYGQSGSFGFKNARVFDRFFDYGHSDFFNSGHFRDFWKPFVVQGQVVRSQWDQQRLSPPWPALIMGSVPVPKIVLLLVVAALVGVVYVVAKSVPGWVSLAAVALIAVILLFRVLRRR